MNHSLLLNILATLVLISSSLALQIPNGHLLVFKDLQYYHQRPPQKNFNYAELYQVDMNGTVNRYWRYSYDYPHILFDGALFAVDIKNSLVYLGQEDQFLALNLYSGEEVIKKPLQAPNLMYFCSYEYDEQERAILGACTGNSKFNWCRIKLDSNETHLEFLYQLPYTAEWGPVVDLYYTDLQHGMVWYSDDPTVIGLDYKTGKIVYTRNSSFTDMCIAHDHKLNRTFGLSDGDLTEFLPWPEQEKSMLKLPHDLRPGVIGDCAYDPVTHVFIGVMASNMNYGMPVDLMLIDVVNLEFKVVPMPDFKQWATDAWSVTGVKFIPNS